MRGFGAILRAVSRPEPADSTVDHTDGPPDRSDPPTEAAASRGDASGDAGSIGAPPGSAVAMLATLLNAVLPTGGAAHGTGARAPDPEGPAPVPGPSDAPPAIDPSGPGATGPAADGAGSGGSGPQIDGAALSSTDLDTGPATGDVRMPRSIPGPPEGLTVTRAGRDAGSPPPELVVLDRAVHFKPVQAGGTSPAPAASGSADPRPGAAADGATPQRDRLPGPGLVSAGVPKATHPLPVRAADPPAAAARLAIAADRPDAGAVEDIRAVTGPARTVLTGAGSPQRETRSVAGPQGTAAGDPHLPAATLPLIAAAITEEVGRVASASQRGMPAPAGGPSADGPLRVLRIQLRPEDLGIVTVELRLIDGQLETHLRASRPETAALLQRDAAVLTDLLRQADYRPEVTVGQARPTDTGGSPSQGQPAFADGGARPGQGGGRQRQPEQHRNAAQDGERTHEAAWPRDGSVYL